MSRQKQYHGVVVPMITPFGEDGDVDLVAAEKIVEHIIKGGASAFVLGTTGEAASIGLQAKVRLARCVVKQTAGRRQIYAGIADNCLANSVEMSRQFSALGVDVAVAHVPNYYPLSEEDIAAYFEQLADKSDLPLMLYNIPITTGMSIPVSTIDRLSVHPNIVGLKDSENNLERLQEATARWRDRRDFVYMMGCSALCDAALSLGADGIVPGAGNIAPSLFVSLCEAAAKGQKSQAKRLQACADQISGTFQNGRILSQSLPVLKAQMHLLGLCDMHVLSPFNPVTSQQFEALKMQMPCLKTIMNERPGSVPKTDRARLGRIQDIPKAAGH